MKRTNSCHYIILLLVLIIFFTGFFSCLEDTINEKKNSKEIFRFNIRTSASDKIITVNNNSDLKEISSSGNGSKINPYIIENKIISGEGSLYCILINNTSRYFVLRNCFLSNASYGLFLSNVSRALIGTNFISNNLERGIYIKSSFNNTFIGNSIYDNSHFGVFLDNCSLNNVENNFIFENNMAGIFLNNSLYNNITENTINSHHCPIYLFSSNYTIVLKNMGEGNTHGIVEINGDSNVFEENKFIKVESRERNETSKSEELIILDFTLILVLMGVFGFFIIAIHFFFKKIKVKENSS